MIGEDGYHQLTPRKYSVRKQLTRSHDKKIIFRHGHIAITDYTIGDNKEFEKSLSVWNEIKWKYELKGGYYIKRLREFRVNRGYDVTMISRFFPHHTPEVENDAYPSDEIDIKLLVGPRSDFQRVALAFMTGQGEFISNLRYTQQLIESQTGSGKTFCGVASICFLRGRAVIFVPFEKLIDQWKSSFTNFTTLGEDDILVVQGSKICKKIIDGKYKHIKVFLFMTDTICSFEKRYGPMETIELLRATNAYIKIIDEVHLDIKAISMVEALSNFRMNYYMSASPSRSDKKEKWIFNTTFKNIPRFGANFDNPVEKHINVIIKKYEFIPHQQQINKMINRRNRWLNTKEYENQLFAAPPMQRQSFDNALLQMLSWAKTHLKDGNRILVLTGTINGTTHTSELARKVFDTDSVSQYYGSLPSKEEKEKAITKTVICATTSSLGTGADIARLQFCFNCETYSNEIGAIQISGRLRKLQDGTPSIYCELVNMSWIKTLRQYEKRKPYLVKRSRTNKLIVID